MNIIELIKFDKLKEENESLKKELAELKKQQLYKKDFKKIITTQYSSKWHHSIETWELKDNSKYNKLPSKEEK